jgi:hypothetical protein
MVAESLTDASKASVAVRVAVYTPRAGAVKVQDRSSLWPTTSSSEFFTVQCQERAQPCAVPGSETLPFSWTTSNKPLDVGTGIDRRGML